MFGSGENKISEPSKIKYKYRKRGLAFTLERRGKGKRKKAGLGWRSYYLSFRFLGEMKSNLTDE